MGNSDKASASTWRKRDAAYRKDQKERRAANAARRAAREAPVPVVDAPMDGEDGNPITMHRITDFDVSAEEIIDPEEKFS